MKTLEYAGPVFPEDYKYKGTFKVNGSTLGPLAEEMLFCLSKYVDTEYFEKIIRFKNFWKDLKPQLGFNAKFPEDFTSVLSDMKKYSDKEKEEKKAADKDAAKIKKEELKKKHGFALVDGDQVEIASYVVESPSILLTRGEDPRFGSWKYRVEPKNVVLNCVNCNPPKDWPGKIVCEPDVLWVAKYDIKCSGFTLPKKVLFSTSSKMRQDRAESKYDKTENIIKNFSKIQDAIVKGIDSNDDVTSQSALISYLIQETGIRIGNERTALQADTRGASTLQRENISFKSNNVIHLSFLGKDSVPYDNDIKVTEQVYNKLKSLTKDLKKHDRIFPKADSGTVKVFLDSIVKGTTPKNLRTVVCNKTLIAELEKKNIKKTDSEATKLKAMFEANLAIAKTLNHQKNVSKNHSASEQKLTDTISQAKEKYEKINLELKNLKKEKRVLKEKVDDKKTLKLLLEKLNTNIEKYSKRLEKAEAALNKKEFTLEKKSLTKDINLGTSLASYADFRVINSWCKYVDLPIEKIYTKTALKNFEWGFDVDENFWKEYAK